MTYYDTWHQAFVSSFQNLWFKILDFVPSLLGAIIVLLVGMFLASLVAKALQRFISYLRIDEFLAKSGLTQHMKTMGWSFTPSSLLSWFVKWFLYLVIFIAVAQTLHIDAVLDFFNRLLLYIPNILIAAIILMVGITAGEFVHGVVVKGVRASRIPSSQAGTLGMIARVAVIVFSSMAALLQLGIAPSLIQILFTGLVISFSLAFGLAFGLGGRGSAERWLENVQREMKDENRNK